MTTQERDDKAIVNFLNSCHQEKPSKGKTVEVVQGRKHKGKIGVVFWHGKDKYSKAFDYCNDMIAMCRESSGTYGYRVGIKTNSGESFFVSAKYVIIKE